MQKSWQTRCIVRNTSVLYLHSKKYENNETTSKIIEWSQRQYLHSLICRVPQAVLMPHVTLVLDRENIVADPTSACKQWWIRTGLRGSGDQAHPSTPIPSLSLLLNSNLNKVWGTSVWVLSPQTEISVLLRYFAERGRKSAYFWEWCVNGDAFIFQFAVAIRIFQTRLKWKIHLKCKSLHIILIPCSL